ncbi:MAG: large conductance mechanosensitive channel protein MscL [Ruminococcus sp.]|nr:large conductance mechanosensitive channel protein MscL [Ruminococcus sp.]
MAEEKKKGFFKNFLGEFKEFIARGNVLDMAVGVVVGGAFTAIVNSLVDNILMPFVGAILGGLNFRSLAFDIPWGKHPTVNVGAFLSAIITFLITAFCVFLIVKAVNAMQNRRKKDEPEEEVEEEVAEDIALLTEIRDLLKAKED